MSDKHEIGTLLATLAAEVEAKEAEIAKLREALRRYGHHEDGSGGRFVCSGSRCFCGLGAAISPPKPEGT